MAAAFGKQWLASALGLTTGTDEALRANGFEVRSCGLTNMYEPQGSPASANGVSVMLEDFSLDISDHMSHIASREDMWKFNYIFCVTSSHLNSILERCPGIKEKVHLDVLGEISDPWHASRDVYARCASLVKLAVDSKMTEFFSHIRKK